MSTSPHPIQDRPVIITWTRHPPLDTDTRLGYRWTSTNPDQPATGEVTVPTRWAY